MNLNKEFLSEVISYLINRGVTLTDVLDTFHEQFEYHEQASKLPDVTWINMKQPSVEESSTPCTAIDSNRNLCRKVEEKTENPAPLKVSLSPNTRDYPTSITPRGKGISKARKMLFEVVEGKTVLEHLKANNINYKLFDTRIRKKWSMEKACTTPMTRVIRPYTKSKKPTETPKQELVIIPDTDVKCLEPEKITGTKKRMMLVNGVMTEIEVSDTDLIQSDIVKPAENTTESVTNATALNGNNVTAVILDTPNPDAIRKDKNDIIEKALKKFITSTTGIEYKESKKDKKPKEAKKDYTFSDLCLKLNLTTHELKEMISTDEFPQPDCDKKWSAKLLKKEGII